MQSISLQQATVNLPSSMPVCCDSVTGTRTDDRLFLVSAVSILKATRLCSCPSPLLQLFSTRGCWHAPQQPLQQRGSVQFCSPGFFYTSKHFSPCHEGRSCCLPGLHSGCDLQLLLGWPLGSPCLPGQFSLPLSLMPPCFPGAVQPHGPACRSLPFEKLRNWSFQSIYLLLSHCLALVLLWNVASIPLYFKQSTETPG